MKLSSLILMFFFATIGKAQLLSWSPQFIQESSTSVTITCDATLGNKGLNAYTPTTDVYVHIGVITNLSTSPANWKYAPFAWGTTTTTAKATYVGNNKWKFTINGGLRTFFGMTNASEKILKIAILFRNGAGTQALRNADLSDMYVPVYDNGFYARIDNPLRTPLYTTGTETITTSLGDKLFIAANASQSSDISIFLNGNLVSTAIASIRDTITTTIASVGLQTIIVQANNGTTLANDTINFLVVNNVNVAPLPAGISSDGIFYESDPTAVTLVLYAPGKNNIAVLGDFNNWTQTLAHQMNKTPDGKYFWLRITGLTAGVEYAYQYLIDGILTVADYNCEKVLDPWNDSYIPASTYPSLKAYPTGKTTGIVSVLQTNQTPYNWQYSLNRPNKKNLMIYELLLRDFVYNKNFQSLKDTLIYLKNLGINTIELMPVNEFEGNDSWGYNPSFFFAPDKYYGTKTALKQFIDECHKNGMAVVFDIAMNHAFGTCPMVQMYWNTATNKPSATNPWFNVDAPHPYGVGYDFNHESQATKSFVTRVMKHWLKDYNIDGFRWDLAKGFTQFNSGTDVGLWANYDASRVAIWKNIYDSMQAISPNSYCILEHFAVDAEEIALSNYGLLLWGNSNNNFAQASMGYSTDWDFSRAIAANRGWATANMVTYAESHDEERLTSKNINYGNSTGTYNIKDTVTALKRQEMIAAFLTMIPGSKMIWQFGELGYDYSVNTCANLTTSTNCRLDDKPLVWNYFANTNRNNLYNVYSKLLSLRNNANYTTAFTTNAVTSSLSAAIKQITVGDASLKVVVAGNFGTTSTPAAVTFPSTGNWYNYFNNTHITVTGSSYSILFQPGDYYVFTDKVVSLPTGIFNPNYDITDLKINVFPNPISNASIVKYDLPNSGNLSIKLIDISGRIIANLFSGFKAKGEQQFNINKTMFNISTVSNGMYFLQIELNGKKQVAKVVVAH